MFLKKEGFERDFFFWQLLRVKGGMKVYISVLLTLPKKKYFLYKLRRRYTTVHIHTPRKKYFDLVFFLCRNFSIFVK